MSRLPKNVVVRRVLVTDLSQELKKERNFLRWMARKYKDENPEQAKAFTTGAEILDRLREDLVAGFFNAGEVGDRGELFTRHRADELKEDLQ